MFLIYYGPQVVAPERRVAVELEPIDVLRYDISFSYTICLVYALAYIRCSFYIRCFLFLIYGVPQVVAPERRVAVELEPIDEVPYTLPPSFDGQILDMISNYAYERLTATTTRYVNKTPS